MWDMSSLTSDWTHIPCIARQILNHWTTREVPEFTSSIPQPSSWGRSCYLSLPFTYEETEAQGLWVEGTTVSFFLGTKVFPGCETLPGQSRENQDWWSHKSEGEDGLGARQVLQGGVLEHPPASQSTICSAFKGSASHQRVGSRFVPFCL